MDGLRRLLLQRLLLAGGSILVGASATSGRAEGRWPRHLFERERYEDALRALLDGGSLKTPGALELEAPDIADNGAGVPVRVTARRADVRAIHLLAEANPVPWVGSFELTDAMVPEIVTRIRMAESARILALAETGDGFEAVAKRVRVVVGGCEVGDS